VNTQLGILYLVAKKYREAEKHLQTAVDRITMRYTRPKDSDALYYLGVVQRRLNKNKEAYDNLYDATWNVGWNTPAYHQLAELDCENGDFGRALGHIDRAISTDINNLKALNLKVAILRKLGRLDEAEKLAGKIMAKDLLDYQSRNEMSLIQAARNKKGKARAVLGELDRIMADREHSYLELATMYSNCGFYEEAIGVLERIERKGNTFPMIYYYLGFFWSRLDNQDKAMEYFETAQSMPHTYCFPFRDESLAALNEALSYRPDDAMAYYYLGNMFYEQQPEKAVAMWEKSRSIDDSFYIVQRNLAMAAQEKEGDTDRAMALYSDAYANNREDPRLMYEYDLVLEQAGVPPQERYERIFTDNHEIAMQKTSALLRELEILVLLEHYDEAIGILTSTKFVETEGARTLRDVYCDAFILRSLRYAGEGMYEAAINDMQMALDYPIGRWGSERRAQMNYLMGTYQEQNGDGAAARSHYEAAASEIVEGTEFLYEKGLAYRKLGQADKANREFTDLLDLASRGGDRDAFRSFERGAAGRARQAQNNYLRGLAYMGMGRRNEAREQFKRAVELDPANVWAGHMLKN
jgi:tetratricopeptide (TPR) repeat protein